jgi:cytochrome c-type biogenesis protein CcmH/NrfG
MSLVSHAHNLLMWLSLGALGLIAFLGMILNAVWPNPSSPWRNAALASLLVMLVHGSVDDALWGYAGILIPVMFIPLALLIRPAESTRVTPRRRVQPGLAIWPVSALGLLVMLVAPAGRAALEANWGALLQTRDELSVYHWPDVPLQDTLRRNGQGEIALVTALYQQAASFDPGNATAQWRLGQIELAQGRYDAACQHLAAAYVAAPEHRATRQLLGECYALSGRADQAVELWRTIDTSESQLALRRWWYESYLGDAERTSSLNRAVAMLLAGEVVVPNEQ